ncbi:spermidine/putrescine ABC transporter ATP-binding protein [Paenibacillus sambharensis]|uniref:Spermidine/putrescine ABC transporter ATP-binding protein n=1 Tax=Paenibacillus sambharensis TaxID=1803190 RepID=A0A2W1LP75_9BACL|nr:ABC transporter ATP-binding protein [Paenibacillus sambharensis]PZD93631.1 spermidine/putrescine ABC transporter ATP-binding protein [Paenibacillus sambharensis]
MAAMLKLENVSHAYLGGQGTALAVEDVNLDVLPGEFVSLVGPSGCGKTTILNMLAGLFPPSRGLVLLDGKPVQGPNVRVGYMLQQDYLFPWRTIKSNSMIGFEIRGEQTRDAESKVLELLAELGLDGSADRYPHELSGGMRQRVSLVRTLAGDPDVLLLDEPFSALDMHIKLQLEELVWQTLRKRGKTAVLVTHDLQEAAAMSDKVVVLAANPGRVERVVTVPESIRQAGPEAARKLSDFEQLVEQLWTQVAGKEPDPAGGAANGQ